MEGWTIAVIVACLCATGVQPRLVLPCTYCLLTVYVLPTYCLLTAYLLCLGLFVLVIAGYVKMKGNAANIKAEYIIKATAGADMQSGNVKIESKIAAASQGGAPTDSI